MAGDVRIRRRKVSSPPMGGRDGMALSGVDSAPSNRDEAGLALLERCAEQRADRAAPDFLEAGHYLGGSTASFLFSRRVARRTTVGRTVMAACAGFRSERGIRDGMVAAARPSQVRFLGRAELDAAIRPRLHDFEKNAGRSPR